MEVYNKTRQIMVAPWFGCMFTQMCDHAVYDFKYAKLGNQYANVCLPNHFKGIGCKISITKDDQWCHKTMPTDDVIVDVMVTSPGQ